MKHLLSCTALALLLATGSAFAAEDAAESNSAQPDLIQPNAAPPDLAQPNAAQSEAAQPNAAQTEPAQPNAADSEAAPPTAAQSDQAQPNGAPSDQAATPSDGQKSTARAEDIGTLPEGALPVSEYYSQSVYDNRDSKIGTVNDMLLDDSGKINAVIIGVGGLLGVGEKNIAVPFSALKVTDKDGSRYLVLQTTKEALQTAPGYVYDSGKKVWMPAPKQG